MDPIMQQLYAHLAVPATSNRNSLLAISAADPRQNSVSDQFNMPSLSGNPLDKSKMGKLPSILRDQSIGGGFQMPSRHGFFGNSIMNMPLDNLNATNSFYAKDLG